MKRKTPRKRLDAMPSGIELERIARPFLRQLGMAVARPYLAIYDRKKEVDPFTGPYDLANKFIPVIEAWIDEAGRSMLVSLDQQDADQWLVRNPEILRAAREATLDLCIDTVNTFTGKVLATLEGMRLDIAASIESGETAGELTNRISQWLEEDSRWRARRIAITESARAYNLGTVKAARDAGLNFDRNGQLTLDEAKLDKALQNNFDEVVKIFSAGTNSKSIYSTAPSGIAGDAVIKLDQMLRSSGLIASQTENSNKKIDVYKADLTKLDQRLTQILERYTKQFSVMESIVGNSNSLKTSLKSTFEGMMASYTNK